VSRREAVQAKITENPSPSGKPGMSAENPTALLGTMRRLRVEYAIREVLAPDKRAVG
jgi:hypothetical protein